MRGFLVGAIVGALVAVMVAPRRGEETREMVRARMDLWQDQVMGKLDQARSELESMRLETMARLDELRSQVGRGGEEMKIRTVRPSEVESGTAGSPSTGV